MIEPTRQAPEIAVVEAARKRQEDASSTDIVGGIADTVEFGGLMIEAASLAVQAGGVVLEAGAATVKVASSGLEVVGSILGAFDGL